MGTAMSAWQRLPRIQLTTTNKQTNLRTQLTTPRPRKLPSPCLVARAGRKHLPVVAPTPPQKTIDVYPRKGPG